LNTSKTFPNIEFKVSRRRVPIATKIWLKEKRNYLSRIWSRKESEIMRTIERYCGFGFPSRTVTKGMTVYLHRRRTDDNLGDMVETNPLELDLYIRRSDTWNDIKGTLVHEIIHCLMWQKFYFDFRTGKPTFFADIFADELMTSVVECMVLGRKPRPKTYEDAIDYALDEAIDRLSRIEQHQKLVMR
jgi:uncharacterized protein YjaZ